MYRLTKISKIAPKASKDIKKSIIGLGFEKLSSSALVYWIPKNILTETIETTVSFRIKKEAVSGAVRLADMITGDIYSIPENILSTDDNGYLCFKNLPATDSPMMITFGDFY